MDILTQSDCVAGEMPPRARARIADSAIASRFVVRAMGTNLAQRRLPKELGDIQISHSVEASE
jgi:hypothetical protein